MLVLSSLATEPVADVVVLLTVLHPDDSDGQNAVDFGFIVAFVKRATSVRDALIVVRQGLRVRGLVDFMIYARLLICRVQLL